MRSPSNLQQPAATFSKIQKEVHKHPQACSRSLLLCPAGQKLPPPPPPPPLDTTFKLLQWQGGGLFEFQTPPPPSPSRPPKDFEPVFLQFQIFGKSVGAKGAELFSCPPKGVFFFNPKCLYSKYS